MEAGKHCEAAERCDDGSFAGVTNCTFPVRSPANYDGPFPTFREPTEIGCFSLDSNRSFLNDGRQMKYLSMPPSESGLNMDLNKGYENVLKKDQLLYEKIDNILRWILSNKEKVIANFGIPDGPSNRTFMADFVCYRGLLTQLVCTVYEKKDDWLICATKFRGTIYLCEFPTDQRKERESRSTPRDRLMCSWGYKFEQYMTSSERNGSPTIDVPVNEKEEYCIALKGRLDKNTILYSAEVDCVNPYLEEDKLSTRRYAELKTSRIITTERQDWNFCRYKLIKWWAQSFLIGIPKVICGFRDDAGIVRNIRCFKTSHIAKMAEGVWSASVGMNFCSSFLQFVNSVVVKDDPYIVYKFYRVPNLDVQCEEVQSPSEFQILPDWYINAFET